MLTASSRQFFELRFSLFQSVGCRGELRNGSFNRSKSTGFGEELGGAEFASEAAPFIVAVGCDHHHR